MLKIFFIAIGLVLFQINIFAQWTQTNGPNNGIVTSLVSSGEYLFAGTPENGVYVSTNSGTNWNPTSLTGTDVRSLAISDTNLYAGMFGGGVAHSTNYGVNWLSFNTGLTNTSVYSIFVKDNIVFAGTFDSGVFYSTNFGTNWTPSNLNNVSVSVFGTDGVNLFAGTGNGVYLSTDNGVDWEPRSNGLNNNYVQAFALNGSILIAGTYGGGIFRSTNNGTDWVPADSGLINSYIQVLFRVGSDFFAGTYGGGVFRSEDNGISWKTINDGLTMNDIYSLTADNNYLYAGTGSNVWKRPLSELITSVSDPQIAVIKEFELSQNYPNPFNPSTTIRYSIPASEFVTLKVYNVLGNEIATLVNADKPAGSYDVEFSAANLSSGIYFYTLQAGSYTQTKKLILMK